MTSTKNKMLFKRIYIEITNRCNLQCSFCPPLKQQQRDMTINEFEHIIKEIKPYTNYVYLHLKGEPLLHPSLSELFKICHENDMNVNLTTNGFFLAKQADLLFSSFALKRINISLQCLISMTDSQKKVYLENLTLFIKRFKNEGKMYLSFRLWNNHLDQKTAILNNELIDFLEKNFESNILANSNKPFFPKVYLSQEDEFIWPNLNHPINEGLVKCLGGKQHIGILVDGTVVICCLDHEGKTNLGNINQDSLFNILNSDKYLNSLLFFKQNKAYLELCKRCLYKKRFK